jgi:hypothetical protein
MHSTTEHQSSIGPGSSTGPEGVVAAASTSQVSRPLRMGRSSKAAFRSPRQTAGQTSHIPDSGQEWAVHRLHHDHGRHRHRCYQRLGLPQTSRPPPSRPRGKHRPRRVLSEADPGDHSGSARPAHTEAIASGEAPRRRRRCVASPAVRLQGRDLDQRPRNARSGPMNAALPESSWPQCPACAATHGRAKRWWRVHRSVR